ncbi:MAG TPA: ergothioneine biosynthesis protein EgtB [Lacipirellulaceae bacterium]|nr:ergothioneine biosynthesis protein EgtB [Lacipirellulaceae bacterium]
MSTLREAAPTAGAAALDALARRYAEVRQFTERLCETLTPEDCCLQSMTSASPVRWHLAHTTWFFETFLLKEQPGYRAFDEHYEVLFNSYYNSVGEQFPRDQRGLLSRPSLADVYEYRRHVDAAVTHMLAATPPAAIPRTADVMQWGLHHEQQHQELILTDVKHLLSLNPLYPTFRAAAASPPGELAALQWIDVAEGIYEIGDPGQGFAYDNERPRHRVFLEPFQLASRPVASGEYRQFVEQGGYRRPELWLSEGWAAVQQGAWEHPLYWRRREGQWLEFTLGGLRPLDPAAPACHLSYFEADAYARWAGARLPTEAEWEAAAAAAPIEGRFVDALLDEEAALHPRAACAAGPLQQLYGDVWEWTSSSYAPYPGYAPPEGALGEYNGKFMCNQYVLRGGSCATHSTHIRPTYRNFFGAEARWQFTGVRLAR